MSKNSTKNTGCLVYLHRTGIILYSPTLSDVARFDFPDTMVRDLEIIDLTSLNTQLAAFLIQLALPVGEVTLIVAQSSYFAQEIEAKAPPVSKAEAAKDAPSTANFSNNESNNGENVKSPSTKALEEAQRQEFIKAVPFADVFSAIVTVNRHRYIIALNREFYDPVVKILEAHHLQVVRIIPDVAVPEVIPDGLSLATGASISANVNRWSESNLIVAAHNMEIGSMQVAPAKGSPERKRMIAMGLGFGFLILVFAVLFYRMYSENQADKAKIAAAKLAKQEQMASASAQLALKLTPSPVAKLPDAPVASDPAQLASAAAQLKVVILNGSGQSGQAAIVQSRLASIGFTQSETGNAATVTSGNTMVVIKPTVPQSLRQRLMATLTDLGLKPLTTESSELTEDIRITTGSIISATDPATLPDSDTFITP